MSRTLCYRSLCIGFLKNTVLKIVICVWEFCTGCVICTVVCSVLDKCKLFDNLHITVSRRESVF